MIKDAPLLRSTIDSGNSRVLQVYGRVGRSYRVESSTTYPAASWQPVTTYTTTNVAQTLGVGSTSPIIFYRMRQQ